MSNDRMKFRYPSLGTNLLVYRGPRFWTIRLDDERGFDGVPRGDIDFVVWDRCRSAVVAIIRKTPSGTFLGHAPGDEANVSAFPDVVTATRRLGLMTSPV
jgi:hypothetical protein